MYKDIGVIIMKHYQMLVLDIDDTLLTSNGTISLATQTALNALQEAGHYLVLASGRPTASMLPLAKKLRLDYYKSAIISFNGAEITDMSTGHSLLSQRIDPRDQTDIINYIQAKGLSVTTYTNDQIIVDYKNDYSHIEAELTRLPMSYQPEFIANLTKPRLKFIGVGDPNITLQCERELNGHFGQHTYVTTSKPYFLEFMNADVSKGKAIEVLCHHLNIPIKNVVACGDGNNDLTMIETAGLGVAMGNATPLLKQAADIITTSNNEDGLVPIIERYFL